MIYPQNTRAMPEARGPRVFDAIDATGRPIKVQLAEPTYDEAKKLRVCVNPRHSVFNSLEQLGTTELRKLAREAERAWNTQKLAKHYTRWRACAVVIDHRAKKEAARAR